MEEYDVSRPTLREALRLLEAQDLISVRRGSHRGPVVSLPDGSVAARALAIQLQIRDASLADVYLFRMLYEPQAARLAVVNATPKGLAALCEVLEEKAAAGGGGDSSAFAAAAWRFHSVLMSLSGNATMSVVTERLQQISAQHSAYSMLSAPDQKEHHERSLRAHRKLVGLIEKGSAAEAEKFWTRHMEVVRDVQGERFEDLQITELIN